MTADVQAQRARRFLFTSTAGSGHFHPVMPLALALKAAGHEVAYAGAAAFRPAVEAAGLTFFPAGGDRNQDPEFQRLMAQLQTMPPGPASEIVIFSQVFWGVNTRLMVPDLVAIGRAWHPDMLIRESGEAGAVIAAEVLGVPHAEITPGANLMGGVLFKQGAAAHLDPIRQQWGLAPDPTLQALHRYLLLTHAPPTFATHDIGVPGAYPPTTHFIRPEFYDRSGSETLPAWVAGLPAQPTVYVTLGTEANTMPGFYPRVLQTLIAGLRDEPVNLIVTLGRDKDPADFGPQPANVHIALYIPQTLLLPHCALLVMHGGSNSLLAALDHGLPLVVVPLIADQFFNAHVTHRLGLGAVVPREQLTPARVRAAVEDVLAQPQYRQTAGRLQAEMQALPDQQYAVELIERVAREPR